MHKLKGSCYCKNITLEVLLLNSPNTYSPRSCDCSYCKKHGSSYLSDPNGKLRIQIANKNQAHKFRQYKEGIAEFLNCIHCGVMIGVIYQEGKQLFAAESSFNPKVKAKTSTATGLMQVLKSSLAPLAGKKRQGWREVPDNYISVTQKDLEDPVINIAAGVRWFGHKNYLMRNHKNVALKKVIRNYHSRDKAGDEYAEKVLKYYNNSK